MHLHSSYEIRYRGPKPDHPYPRFLFRRGAGVLWERPVVDLERVLGVRILTPNLRVRGPGCWRVEGDRQTNRQSDRQAGKPAGGEMQCRLSV